MTVQQLPDFDHILALSQGNLDSSDLSECHGVACGLLVRSPDSNPDAYIGLLDMLEIVSDPSVSLRDSLIELHAAAGKQLADAEMQLVLWLPEDNESLEDRTSALAQWCNGFMAALGSGQDGRLETLSEDAGEALADMREIAMAEVSNELSANPGEQEEEENAFAEIVEYIRIAVLILREDLRGPVDGDSIH